MLDEASAFDAANVAVHVQPNLDAQPLHRPIISHIIKGSLTLGISFIYRLP